MANRAGGYRSRTGTTSSTSSRYQQEYPPSDLCLTSFVASPVRRASSETRLEVLHHKEVVDRLERGMAARDGPRELKKLSEKGSLLFAETASTHSNVPASSGHADTVGTNGVESATQQDKDKDKTYLKVRIITCDNKI